MRRKGDFRYRRLMVGTVLILLAAAGWSGQKKAPAEASEFDYAALLKTFKLRNIGPANMGGRTVDFAVPLSNTSVIYAAVGPSGLWKSENNGVTWKASFDKESTVSVGAVAVSQSHPDIVWVGTGEATARNSVAIGDGIYKSEDTGRTWKNTGLKETRFISRIVADPDNPDVVYVAAQGHLWGPNEERGVYKTTDGGKTWKRILYVNQDTGACDLAMDPSNSRILYAGMWDHRRLPYHFRSGGESSGLYKTTDGGETWRKPTSGIPGGVVGRIGVDVCRSKPNVVYALIEHQNGGLFRSDDKGETWTRACDKRTYDQINFRPFYYSRLTVDPTNDLVVYVYSGQCYVSRDGGKTFQVISRGTHPDHHALWVNPLNPNHLIDGNDGGIDISYDGGKTWYAVESQAWAEVYQVGFDLRDPYSVNVGLQDNGNWQGPSNSKDRSGILNLHWFPTGGGDGFYAQIDPQDPDTLYRNLQMGGIERHNTRTGEAQGIKPVAPLAEPPYRFNWNSPIYISPHNHEVVYFGGNFLFKTTDRGRSWIKVSPDLSTNDPKKQRDSGGPITADNTGAEIHCTILTISESPLREGLIWVGTDDGMVQVTRDCGRNWENVTKNIKGLPPEDNWVTRVEASRFNEGTGYITISRHQVDDFKPYIFKTGDYGKTWISLRSNLPEIGYLHVVREDLQNPNLLFAGSEFGLFFSFDGGEKWIPFRWDFPTVAVRDIQIHPRERDLIVGTHGRGVWIMDDLRALEELTPEALSSKAVLFDVRPATMHATKSSSDMYARSEYAAENPLPGAYIHYYLNPGTEKSPKVKVAIYDQEGKEIRNLAASSSPGLHRVIWDLRESLPPGIDMEAMAAGTMSGFGGGSSSRSATAAGGAQTGSGTGAGAQRGAAVGRGMGFGGGFSPPALPGEYKAVLEVGEQKFEKAVLVRADPGQDIPVEERKLNQKYAREAAELSGRMSRLLAKVNSLSGGLQELEMNLKSMKNIDQSVSAKVKAVKEKLSEIEKTFERSPEGQTGYRQSVQVALRGGRLPEQIMRLVGEITRYPGAPTQTAITRLEEFKAILDPWQAKMDELVEKEIPELNKLLAEKGVPYIRIL
jgi:photosystem II stability/assembly factor-like uncharacterized protein